MKLIMEQWRNFRENHGKEIISEVEFNNLGELITAMEVATGEKSAEEFKKALADEAKGAVVDIAPFGGTITKLIGAFFNKVRSQVRADGDVPPEAQKNPLLLALFVEPDMSKVVADKIELQMIDKLEKEIRDTIEMLSIDTSQNPFDMELEEMDMTKFLTKFISDEYDGTILEPGDGDET